MKATEMSDMAAAVECETCGGSGGGWHEGRLDHPEAPLERLYEPCPHPDCVDGIRIQLSILIQLVEIATKAGLIGTELEWCETHRSQRIETRDYCETKVVYQGKMDSQGGDEMNCVFMSRWLIGGDE